MYRFIKKKTQKNIFKENNLERIEILKNKIGLKPSIILDGVSTD